MPSSPEQQPTTVDRDIFGNAPKGRPDWSHRRGEPRQFAILWLMYLMGATVLMLASISAARAISPSITRPAATSMLVVCTVGVCVLWPVVRLSQRRPERPVRAVAADLPVVALPVFALVLPQGFWFLAGWSMGIVLSVCGVVTAWSLLVGALLAFALTTVDRKPELGIARTVWAGVFVLIAVGGPIATALGASVAGAFSPITMLTGVVRDEQITGLITRGGPEHVRALGFVFIAAGAAWAGVLGLGIARDGGAPTN